VKYPIRTLGDYCDRSKGLIQTGPFGSQLHQEDYVEVGHPVVMPKDIKDGRIDETTVARVTESMAAQLQRHKLKVGALVMPRRGDIGKRALIRKEQEGFLCGTGCIKIELDNEVLNPQFLYYFLEQPQITDWIEKRAIGSTMLNLNTQIIRSIEIPEFPISEQNRIADILSSYDDLIENNRRRIQLLEESARLLYQEWFVRLRFPGHEQVPVHDGVPEGWMVQKIADVAETIGGGTPSTSVPEYWDNGEVTWFVPKDITNNDSFVILESERKITAQGLRESSTRMLPAESILMTSRASIGFFAIYEHPACTNQGFISVVPKRPELQMYLLYNLYSRREEIEQRAGGTTFKEISKSTFRNLEILVPEQEILIRFQQNAYTIFEQVRVLKKQKQRLQQARDLLLPRLMRGELLS
jgi:type I restriction enzyme, S subunit